MRRIMTLWIFVGLFLFAGTALAQNGSTAVLTEEEFNELDANNDGTLDYDEFEAGAQREYEAMDVDRSGDLNWKEDKMQERFGAEFAPGATDEDITTEYGEEQEEPETVAEAGTMTEERFNELDVDGDGNVSWSEYQENVRMDYEGMDVDKSGDVNWKEDQMEERQGMEPAPGAQDEEISTEYASMDEQSGSAGAAGAASGTGGAARDYSFEEFDMDKDENISWYEYQQNVANPNSDDFNQLDADNDTVLSMDEFDSEKISQMAAQKQQEQEQVGVAEKGMEEEAEYGEMEEQDEAREPGVSWTGAETGMEETEPGMAERDILSAGYIEDSFDTFDVDDDGRITESEYQEGMRVYFDEIDTDRSGDLNWKEDQMQERFGAEFAPGATDEDISTEYGEEQEEPETVAEAGSYIVPRAKFEDLDANDDGTLTFEELESGAPDFDEIDLDGDGSVTIEEFR